MLSRPGARAAAGATALVVLVAAAAVALVSIAPGDWRRALAGGLAGLVVLLAGVALAERGRLRAGRAAAAGERAAARAHADRLAGELESLREEFTARDQDKERAREERALRDSVQAAFEGVARTLHRMATVQQGVLDRVERALDDPAVLGEVMKADHAAAQMTRKAQTLLVMCDVWPARRETRPVSLYDCVRGAMSRIVEFGRVEVHGGESLYVIPTAVEGLMHAIAELLDNATMFSPSSTQVVVTVKTVAAGAVVEIDDAGLGMPFDVLDAAAARLKDEIDLTALGAVPRLGLACVGRWTRELGFRVELSGASAYGGTRAVVFTPLALLTEPAGDAPGAAVPEARDEAPADPGGGAAPRASAAVTALPRRQSRRRTNKPATARRTPATPATPVTPATPAPSAPGTGTGRQTGASAADTWSPEAARASIASVMSGTRRGRGITEDSGETAQDEGDPQ